MAIFGLKTHFKKFFLYYFCPLPLPMPIKRVKMVPKQVFIGAGTKRPPPTALDAFYRVRLVGLNMSKSVENSNFSVPFPFSELYVP